MVVFFSFGVSTLTLGYEIRDLEKNGINFEVEAELWSATALRNNSIISNCNGTYLLGGYNVLGPASGTNFQGQYFERTYTGLPIHTLVTFTFNFWLLDNWNYLLSNDGFNIQIDSKVFNAWTAQLDLFAKPLCGLSAYKDTAGLKIYGTVLHNNSSLTLRVISRLASSPSIESFGFRDVNLFFVNTANTYTEGVCGRLPNSLGLFQCACADGTYPNSLGICQPCNPICGSCYGPSPNECFNCAPGSSYNGTQCIKCADSCHVCHGPSVNQCNTCKPGYYLLNNNTCVTTCEAPLVSKSNGDMVFCESPCAANEFIYSDGSCEAICLSPYIQTSLLGFQLCSVPCNSGQFLYQNGTCHNTCSHPLQNLTISGVNYCNAPCNTTEVFYWTNSCESQCNFPLVLSTVNGVAFCNYPCLDSEYLYWNGSCLNSCSSPFLTNVENGKNFCDIPCEESEYLFENGTCGVACNFPFISTVENQTRFCNNPCSTSEYLYQNGSCINSCDSPYLQSLESGIDYCNTPCSDNEYLYSNGSCISSCDHPSSQRIESGINYCDFPCNQSEYLYSNGSCINSCNPPYLQGLESGIDYCNTPCSDNGYLYSNGSCINSCNSPYVQRIESEINYCDFSCSESEYLFSNNSCIALCDSPLVQEIKVNERYCNYPCQPNQYLYWDGACLNHCDSPLFIRNESGFNYCDYPCAQEKYLFWDQTCLDSCQTPLNVYIQFGKNFCLLPCNSSNAYYYEESGNCNFTCSAPYVAVQNMFYKSCRTVPIVPSNHKKETSEREEAGESGKTAAETASAGTKAMTIGVTVVSLIGSANPATFGLSAFVKMLPYLRYMKINYPSRLEIMLDNLNSTLISFGFGPVMSQNTQNKFRKYPLPGKFDRYGLHSNFIVNYWQNMTSLLILLGAIIVLEILCKITKNRRSLDYAFTRLRKILKWNFVLMVVCSNMDGVILYTSLELRTVKMESTLGVFSILFCLFMNFVIFYIFGLIVHIIRNIRRRKYQISPEKITSVLQQWEKFQTLFVGYKDDTITNHCFALLFMCRTYIFNLIIAHLFEHPLLQAILIVILSIQMLIYLVCKRPFKSKLVLCQSITDEITLLLVNICVLILASLDASGGGNFSTRENLGDIIIIANVTICISSNIYLLAFLCVGIQGAYNAAKSHKGRGVVSWFASLLAPFQSGGMDLEVNAAEGRRVSHLPKLKNLHLLKAISNDSTSIESSNVKFIRTLEEDFNKKEHQVLSFTSDQDQEPYSQSTTKGCLPNDTLEQEQPLSPDFLPKKASKFKKLVQLNPEAESPRSSSAEKQQREKVFDFEQKVFEFEKDELNNSKQTE